jgi:archaellum component FlaC
MEREKLIITLQVLLFLLLAGTFGWGFYLYKEQSEEISNLKQQQQFIRKNVMNLERSLEDLKFTFENLNSRFKNYVQDLLNMKSRLNVSESERKRIFSRLESMGKQIQEWEMTYSNTLKELSERLENLRENAGLKGSESVEEIELGEISVEKEE